MAQSRIPTSYLDRLPLELISMIFKNLGHDLVAHVTFSTLRSDIYDFCYSSLGGEFWQRILRASGLATLNLTEGDIECQTRDEWELLARECVQHAEVCTHPKCGMVRIRQNEEAVRKSLNHGVDLMHTFSTDNPNDTATLQELHILEFSPVWDGIAFKKARAGPTKKWQSAAFVRPAGDDSEDDSEDDIEDDAEDDTEDDDTLQYGDELVEHPVLWRSFATFPPVTDFTMLLHEDARMEPWNSDGVIVADVLQNILDIDNNTHVHNLDFVELIRVASTLGSREQLVPRSWTLSETLSALTDFTDWLILVRWVGLKPRSILENMIFCEMEVKTQELPDRYGDFFHLTTYH